MIKEEVINIIFIRTSIFTPLRDHGLLQKYKPSTETKFQFGSADIHA